MSRGAREGWISSRLLVQCGHSDDASRRVKSKSEAIPIFSRKVAIISPCHLCNTVRKTGSTGTCKAVPLLLVQKSSVIVIVRRRGASRGRPVLGGSLKSLAFSGCVRRREAT